MRFIVISLSLAGMLLAQNRVDLTKQVQGILPTANGGTGNTSGPLPTGSGNKVVVTPADGSSGVSALRALVVADEAAAGASGSVQFNNAGKPGGNGALVPSALTTPAAPSVVAACAGTCATAYSYAVEAVTPVGRSLFGAVSVAVNNAVTLDGTHFNTITPPACQTYQTRYFVSRLTSPVFLTLVGVINCGSTLIDNGLPDQGARGNTVNTNQVFPGTDGISTPGALRAFRDSGLAVGPDYMVDQLYGQVGTVLASVGDAVYNQIADAGSCPGGTFPQCSGFFTVQYSYNANAPVKSAQIAQYFTEGALRDDGSAAFADFGITDQITGLNVLFVDNTGAQDQTGNMEGKQYFHDISFDGVLSKGGLVVSPPLSGTTASIGGGLLTAGTCASGTATVTGATTGMALVVTPVTYPGDGADWAGYVSGTNTVTVKVCGLVTVTPGVTAYNVRAIQ